jgi:hypothetical protein
MHTIPEIYQQKGITQPHSYIYRPRGWRRAKHERFQKPPHFIIPASCSPSWLRLRLKHCTTQHGRRAREHPPKCTSNLSAHDGSARRSRRGRGRDESLGRSCRAASPDSDCPGLRESQGLAVLHRGDDDDLGLLSLVLFRVGGVGGRLGHGGLHGRSNRFTLVLAREGAVCAGRAVVALRWSAASLSQCSWKGASCSPGIGIGVSSPVRSPDWAPGTHVRSRHRRSRPRRYLEAGQRTNRRLFQTRWLHRATGGEAGGVRQRKGLVRRRTGLAFARASAPFTIFLSVRWSAFSLFVASEARLLSFPASLK